MWIGKRVSKDAIQEQAKSHICKSVPNCNLCAGMVGWRIVLCLHVPNTSKPEQLIQYVIALQRHLLYNTSILGYQSSPQVSYL